MNDIPCALYILGKIKRITKEDVINLIKEGNVTFIAKDFNPLINFLMKVLNLNDKKQKNVK